MNNPTFNAVLEDMKRIHDAKNADYTGVTGNPYANFELAAEIAGVSVDTVFAVMIANKVARLREVTRPGAVANYESARDNMIDLANYAVLRVSYAIDHSAPVEEPF